MVEDIKNPKKSYLNFDDPKHPPYIGDDGFLYVWSTEKGQYISFQKNKADLVDGKVPAEQLPDDFGGTIEFKVVDELPEKGEKNTIYLVPNKSEIEENLYDEYIWVNGSWEVIGNVSIDLSNYYTKPESDEKFAPSELFFILPKGTQFPYTLTEEDKTKLEKAIFIKGTTPSGTDFIVSRFSTAYVGNWYGTATNNQFGIVKLTATQIQSVNLTNILPAAIRYTEQNLTDEQKLQVRTNIEAEKVTIVENVEGAEVTLDVKGGRKYMCGELTSLTINSIEKSVDTTVIYFTSGATPSQFVYPENTPISGWDQPEANKNYVICVFNGNLSIEPYE